MHFLRPSRVVQEEPQEEKLRRDRCPVNSFYLRSQSLGQAAFESLARQHRASPRPKTDCFGRWSLEQVDRSIEDLPRGQLVHGSSTSPRASRSLSLTKFKSTSRATAL